MTPQEVPHQVLDGGPLAEEGIDHGGAFGHEGRLAEEAQEGEDAVEGLGLPLALQPHTDPLAEFGQQDQVQDNGGGQERILRRKEEPGRDRGVCQDTHAPTPLQVQSQAFSQGLQNPLRRAGRRTLRKERNQAILGCWES